MDHTPRNRSALGRLAAAGICLAMGLVTATTLTPARAEPRRVALVIGNAAYDKEPLANPVNDARAVARTLKDDLGFDVVISGIDLGRLELHRKVTEFRQALQYGDIAVFYYSGHGVEFGGKNFLLPVKYDITFQQDVEVQAYALQSVVDQMEAAQTALNVVILDACRDNPLPSATKSIGSKGLAAPQGIEPGTLIAYATAPGRTAADGTGPNSPYTAVLLEQLRTDGRTARVSELFNSVGYVVSRTTKRAQVPWVSSSPVPPLTLGRGLTLINPAGKSIQFTVRNYLGRGQISERVEFFLEDSRIGLIEVDESAPAAAITLSVPSDGTHQIRTFGSARQRTAEGDRSTQLSGSTSVPIAAGSSFYLGRKAISDSHELISLDLPTVFQVRNFLGSSQISESVEVAINSSGSVHNRASALLEIDQERPSAIVDLTIHGEGDYDYSLSGVVRFATAYGEVSQRISGAGSLTVRNGDVFSLWVKERTESHAILEIKKDP